MQLLSSFELIVQPIIPQFVASRLELPNPVAVQAYFLLLSNYSNVDASIELTFTANPNTDGASNLNGGGIIPSGDKNFGPVTAFISFVGPTPLVSPLFKINSDSSAQAEFSISPKDTALFLLQPDVSPLEDFDKTTEFFSYELRGFVEIKSNAGTNILCSPQVRGTFFELGKKGELLAPPILLPDLIDKNKGQLALDVYAQQAYALPTPGNALYKF